MPPRYKAPIAVALGVAALAVLIAAEVLGWDLGRAHDMVVGLAAIVAGYLVPSPGEQRGVSCKKRREYEDWKKTGGRSSQNGPRTPSTRGG